MPTPTLAVDLERAIEPPVVTPDFTSRVFYATSASHPEIRHTLGVATTPTGVVRVSCTCPAGRYARPDRRPVPCRHARAVVGLLAEHDLVVNDADGVWRRAGSAVAA